MKHVAAIDIGSNALRLAISKVEDGKVIHTPLRMREPVRLGSDVFDTGSLSDKTYQALSEALQKFNNQMENYNVGQYRAIATSAMREAKNSSEVVSRLKSDTGISVEVISGQEEAQLVFTAIDQKVSLGNEAQLLIDIGGGSIELVAINKGQILKKESFPLGTVRTIALYKTQDSKDSLAKWFKPYFQKKLEPFFEGLPPFRICVGTGGNMDRFAKIKEIEMDEVIEELSYSEIKKIAKDVQKFSLSQRIENFQIRKDRADVIEPAVVAALTLMEMAQSERLLIPQVGIKEGMIHKILERSSIVRNGKK